jgi:hypothetical protein
MLIVRHGPADAGSAPGGRSDGSDGGGGVIAAGGADDAGGAGTIGTHPCPSRYCSKMLERFAEHQALLARIGTAESQYRSTHGDYESAVLALVETRVRVRIADYFADQRAKLLELAARGADGGRAGPITKKLFPEGLRTIVQPVGPSEVTELRRVDIHDGGVNRSHARGTRG